jgi:hypothetical protein
MTRFQACSWGLAVSLAMLMPVESSADDGPTLSRLPMIFQCTRIEIELSSRPQTKKALTLTDTQRLLSLLVNLPPTEAISISGSYSFDYYILFYDEKTFLGSIRIDFDRQLLIADDAANAPNDNAMIKLDRTNKIVRQLRSDLTNQFSTAK